MHSPVDHHTHRNHSGHTPARENSELNPVHNKNIQTFISFVCQSESESIGENYETPQILLTFNRVNKERREKKIVILNICLIFFCFKETILLPLFLMLCT